MKKDSLPYDLKKVAAEHTAATTNELIIEWFWNEVYFTKIFLPFMM